MARRRNGNEASRATNGAEGLDAETRLRLLADNAQDVIFRVRVAPDVAVEYVSASLKTMLGYAPGEYYADASLIFDRVDDRDRETASETVRSRCEEPYEVRMVRRDGSTIWTEHTNAFVKDESGALVAIEGMVRDITERKRAEEALREFERRAASVIDAAPVGISITRLRDQQLIDANPSFLALLELTRAEVIGHTSLELGFIVDRTDRDALFRRVVEEGVEHRSEFQVRTKSGEVRDVMSSLVLFEVGGEPCILAMSNDITEYKRVERDRDARIRQQAAVVELGMLALSGVDLQALLDQATRSTAEVLNADCAKVLELQPSGELLLRAGVGWHAGLVGRATVPPDTGSQAGYTLAANEPVLTRDLREERRFAAPPLLVEHGVLSGVSVVIGGAEGPYGVLGIHATRARSFSEDDVHFVQGVANVLGAAVGRVRTDQSLRESERRFKQIFECCPIPAATFRADDMRILDVNEGFTRLFGCEREEMIGRLGPEVNMFVDPGEPAGSIAMLERDGELHNYQMVMRGKTARPVTVLWSVSYTEANGERRIIAMATDVTELRGAEAELQRWREEGEAKADRAVAGENRYGLSFREFTVLQLLAAGKTDKEIAAELVVSPLTVHKHVGSILAKMDAHSRTEASTRALREGLVD